MDETNAAVIGAGVVSFLPGLSLAQKNKVKLALALAERATQTASDEGLVQDWYAYYRNQLKFMGWDAVSAEQVHWPDAERAKQVDKVLGLIAKTAGERFASNVEVSLQRLRNNPQTLATLEKHARERGHFQLLPCAPAGQHRVDMVLYYEVDTRDAWRAGFLSRKRDMNNVRAELVRFNILAFENSYLPKVHERVVDVSLKRIHDYDI
ncbi:hypothetical protein [Pseudomonas putida]|uniref:hypothetical protein n=1 Tax=Pseudomonas putida TaxID=303 RepID=UPI000818F88B|nr:hypothetical protein [Pseudomonas putida]OCT34009.1 hypothetical protein A6E20_23025 [Pseudomonas putida]OCT34111.1 hypothetical protein A6E23_23585 [Pseudomonas putida]OCT36058.1 hypothetical protein A6E24_23035 [Pseudomonas putida]OCT37904.1 hypothetical protein A6E19_17440 [Pseudomonas putida]